MPMHNSERALATLVGEAPALFMIVQALVRTHPNPDAVATELATIELSGPAQLEAHPVPDAAVAGYYDTIAAIRKSLAANPLYNPNSDP
jgi:hypothetical protein